MTTPLMSESSKVTTLCSESPKVTTLSEAPKPPKTRCAQCSKKLGVMAHVCKCEKQFCTSHLQPQEHQCTYDHKSAAKAVLQSQLEIGPLSQKIERI